MPRLPIAVAVACCGSLVPGQDLPLLLHEPLDTADARWRGAVPIADGAEGGAARFDGRGACIDVGPCGMTSQQAFTLRCRLRTTRGSFCTPLMARAGDAVALSLVVGRTPGTVSFEAWSWATAKLVSQRRIDDGAWHTIEVAYEPEPGVALLSIDGEVQGTAELGVGGAPQAVLRLGDNIGAVQPFAGDLDAIELRAGTTRRAELAAQAPVLPRAERDAALRALRERLLPRTTPALAAAAADAWPARREAVRAHVRDAVGLAPEPVREPLAVQVHAATTRDGVRLERISWSGFPGHRATGWLWRPAAATPGRHPAVLCPHGHWEHGAMHPVVQARCAAFAQFGWVALAVDSVHVEHVASGVHALGAMTWHNQRALDVLLARDDVDPARVACTGASGGGQQTYYLMALEDRLAAAAPMVMACYFAEIVADTSAHCGCNHVPRLAAGTDVIEMCAVFAPRPAMFGSVSGDWTRHFPQQGLPELAAHWTRLGANPLRARHADEGHNYDRPMREAVYGFLHDVLLGPAADGAPRAAVAEPAFAPFDLAALQELARTCPPATLPAAELARAWLVRRGPVAELAALAPGLAFDVVPQPIEWRDADGVPWRRGVVRGSDGVPIPLRLRQRDATPDAWTVVVDARGMPAARHDAAAGTNTVVLDARPYGEWAPFRAAWQRNGILLGRGEGYQAALDVATVVASLPGAAPVHLVGRGEAAVVALLAAHLAPRVVQLRTDPLGPDYASDGNRLPLCPELLRYRDLPELVRTLPARVRRVDGDGR